MCNNEDSPLEVRTIISPPKGTEREEEIIITVSFRNIHFYSIDI